MVDNRLYAWGKPWIDANRSQWGNPGCQTVARLIQDVTDRAVVWFGLLGFNASATARVISRRRNDDDEISFLVAETGVPGGKIEQCVGSCRKSSRTIL